MVWPNRNFRNEITIATVIILFDRRPAALHHGVATSWRISFARAQLKAVKLLTPSETMLWKDCPTTPQRRLLQSTSSSSSDGTLLHSEWVAAAGTANESNNKDKSQSNFFLYGLLDIGSNIYKRWHAKCASRSAARAYSSLLVDYSIHVL